MFTATTDRAITDAFEELEEGKRDLIDGMVPVTSRLRQEWYRSAIQFLRPNGPLTQGSVNYRTRRQEQSQGGMTCENSYVDGYIWVWDFWGDAVLLEHCSQNISLQWETSLASHLSPGHPHWAYNKLNSVVLVRVKDEGTLAVVYWIMSHSHDRDAVQIYPRARLWHANLLPDWTPLNEGRKVLRWSLQRTVRKAAAALLGTNSGLMVAKMMGLRRHKSGCKVLESITIFRDDMYPPRLNLMEQPECLPTLVFTFQDRIRPNHYPSDTWRPDERRFPDCVPAILGDQNPYALLARKVRPTAIQWQAYDFAEEHGRLDIRGNPSDVSMGNGPPKPGPYYNEFTGTADHYNSHRTGFLRGSPYDRPAAASQVAGPGAGLDYEAVVGPSGEPAQPSDEGPVDHGEQQR